MIVTPFGDLSLDDDVALERFLDAHARRHETYVKLTNISGGTLRGNVDGDWMHRHAARHMTLATFARIPLASADTKVLALPGKWRTNQELIDWSELHDRLHRVIDLQLQIS